MQLDLVFVLVAAVVLLILGNSSRYRHLSNFLMFVVLTIVFARVAGREFQRGYVPGGVAFGVPAIACALLGVVSAAKRARELIAEMRQHL